MKKILVACEESQEVCKAFRLRGFEAFSCDVQECSGGRPEWHIRDDVRNVLADGGVSWDLIIAHPPCTRLCSSGQRWLYYGNDEYRTTKQREQCDAIRFFLYFTELKCKHVAIENPVGIMSGIYRKPDQIYNPFDFVGETEAKKKTCLWLKGLPILNGTRYFPLPKDQITHGIWKAEFNGKHFSWNDPEVAKLRSKTPHGVAIAMALQWGDFITNGEQHIY